MNSAITCSPAHKYAEDIVSGRIISCRLTKLAAERYFRDLEQADAKGFYFDVDAAQYRIDFYKFCRHSEGKWGGQVFEPEPWQQFIDWNVYGWKQKKNDKRRFRTVYIEVARKNGKSSAIATDGLFLTGYDGEHGSQVFTCAALALDTRVPTLNGWTTIGKLQLGDKIFDVDGNVCSVTYMTPVMSNHNCYELELCDGSRIVADEQHLWETTAGKTFTGNSGSIRMPKLRCDSGRSAVFTLHHKRYNVCPWNDIDKEEKFKLKLNEMLEKYPLRATKTAIRTTKELYDTVRTFDRSNHSIRLCGALNTETEELPIDPYVLGIWLGDGRSNRGHVVFAVDDAELLGYIEDCGREVMVMPHDKKLLRFTIKGLTTELNKVGLIDNKHIPNIYLRASIPQRIELLKGLMDTDGTCTKTGECRFSSSFTMLAHDFYELITSLGIKAHIHIHKTLCKPNYIISFKAYNDFPVFKLQRKIDRQIERPQFNGQNNQRYVREIRPVESVPVKCIEVDSPTHLFLVGNSMIPTHNTKKDQARIIHRISTRMVKASPALRKTLGTFKDSIFCESMGGTFIPLGQDSKTEDGWNVHAALVDEYHAHPDSTLHDVMRSGMGSREQPLMLIITTAGFDKTSACYQEREYLVGILEGTFDDESYFGIIYTVDDENKWDDEIEWKKSNPNLGISVSVDDMWDMCLKAKNSPSKQNEFKTKKLNIWTETLTRWITSEAWDACGTPVDADGLCGRECVGAFDLSSVSDLTAWALCFKPDVSSDPYRFLFRFFLPQYDLEKRFVSKDVLNQIRNWIRQGFITATPGNSIDYDFVMEQIRSDGERFDIKEIPYDPYNATQVVNELMKDGFELTPFRQGFLTMSPAAKSFEAAVLDKRIAHGNNPVMRWMIACTDVQSDPAGNIKPVKPDRGKSAKRIDGVIASIMSYARAMGNEDTRSVYETRGILVA